MWHCRMLVCDPTATARAGKSTKTTDIPVECVMFPSVMLVSKQDGDSTAKHDSHAAANVGGGVFNITGC